MKETLQDILKDIEVNEFRYLNMLNDNVTGWIQERDHITELLGKVNDNTIIKKREILQDRFNVLGEYLAEAMKRMHELESRISWINKFDLTPYEQ